MAATVLEWANPDPLPNAAFVDTQFLFDLYGFLGGTAKAKLRQSAANEFFELLLSNGTQLWVTPSIIQEACYRYFRHVRDEEEEKKPQVSRGDSEAEGIRQAPVMYAFVLELKAIAVRLPGERGPGIVPGSLVARTMDFLARKHQLKPMDALHAACARLDGPSVIISDDSHFQKVDDLVVYAYEKAPS